MMSNIVPGSRSSHKNEKTSTTTSPPSNDNNAHGRSSFEWELLPIDAIDENEHAEQKQQLEKLKEHVAEFQAERTRTGVLVESLEEEMVASASKLRADMDGQTAKTHQILRRETQSMMEELDSMRAAMMRSIMSDRSMRKDEMDALRSYVRSTNEQHKDQVKEQLKVDVRSLVELAKEEQCRRLDEHTADATQVKQELKSVLSTMAEMKEDVQALRGENRTLSQENQGLKADVNALRMEAASQHARCTDHLGRSLIDGLTKRQRELEMEVRATRSSVESDVQTAMKQKVEQEGAKAVVEQKVRKMEDDLHSTQSAMKLLRGEHTARDAQVDKLAADNQWLTTAYGTMVEKCASMTQQLAKKEVMYEQLMSCVAELTQVQERQRVMSDDFAHEQASKRALGAELHEVRVELRKLLAKAEKKKMHKQNANNNIGGGDGNSRTSTSTRTHHAHLYPFPPMAAASCTTSTTHSACFEQQKDSPLVYLGDEGDPVHSPPDGRIPAHGHTTTTTTIPTYATTNFKSSTDALFDYSCGVTPFPEDEELLVCGLPVEGTSCDAAGATSLAGGGPSSPSGSSSQQRMTPQDVLHPHTAPHNNTAPTLPCSGLCIPTSNNNTRMAAASTSSMALGQRGYSADFLV